MQAKHFILIILLGFFSEQSFSQDSFETTLLPPNPETVYSLQKNMAKAKGFSMENISMGILGGVNFSLIIPISGNAIFSSSGGDYSKQYNPFYQNIGYQMGFSVRYSITPDIKVSIQPSMNDYSFKYSNEYSWQGSTNLSFLVEHNQNLRFFEIPLLVGYYLRAQQWQPYVQVGAYYASLMNSNSYADITETTDNQTLNYSTTTNSDGIYKKNQFGIIGGAGIRYAAGKTMIGIEANYRLLLSSLSSSASLYSNNQVTGNYDITDELLFNNIAISINVTVPLVCKASKDGPFIFCKSN